MTTREIQLPFQLVIRVWEGGGAIKYHGLRDECPYCGNPECYADCDGSAGDIDNLETAAEMYCRKNYNTACDGMEALILAAACAGIEVDSPAFMEAIETAVDACRNNIHERNHDG